MRSLDVAVVAAREEAGRMLQVLVAPTMESVPHEVRMLGPAVEAQALLPPKAAAVLSWLYRASV
jgi:hypothetical protein